MNIIDVIILCLFNLFSFIVGAKIGQHSINGKDIIINPVKAVKKEIRDIKEDKKQTLKKAQIETMLNNIDNYDGTGFGQKQIPKD